ncbi:hypothetical protein [Streptacidiphilus carbonis]|uniref:hypothetical protein n=1 Tax=Streptacidiphilus carbonis TaxID=105422 RepID=UPI0005A84D2C|nr:hypothetical protein [Streptacidiphilus carbonis]
MSSLSDLQDALKQIQQATPMIGRFMFDSLPGAIGQALGVPGPPGSVSAVNAQADDYRKAGAQASVVETDLTHVSTSALPKAWTGPVAETAAQAVASVAAEVANTVTVLGQAAAAMEQWGVELSAAQALDLSGIAELTAAQQQPMSAFASAQQAAVNGCRLRIQAATNSAAGAQTLANLLTQLAAQARAERVTSGAVDPLGAVELANASGAGGDILSAAELGRASARLDSMSPADRAAFEQLLQNASSPEEAAYLWQALAAGNSVSQVQQFDSVIHAHGSDPDWLYQHLSPTVLDSADPSTGNTYSQGAVNDCVAASTVVAEAKVNPVLMLQLSTSSLGLQQALQQEYLNQYDLAQLSEGNQDPLKNPADPDGVGPKGVDFLANKDLGSVTGTTYQPVDVNSSSDRQATVPRIEQSVASGVPVPMDIGGDVKQSDGSTKWEGHQVMIVGASGDQLEVYNPWGSTSWISTSDYVNGNVGSITGTTMNTPFHVEVPKQ